MTAVFVWSACINMQTKSWMEIISLQLNTPISEWEVWENINFTLGKGHRYIGVTAPIWVSRLDFMLEEGGGHITWKFYAQCFLTTVDKLKVSMKQQLSKQTKQVKQNINVQT